MKSVLSFVTLLTSVLAASRTSAPSGCITAGSGGTYSTVQKAVDALSTSSTAAQCIFISPGTYKEQVVVSARSAQLTFYGYTDDTLSYSANQVTITNNLAAESGLTDDETGTLRVQATNFKAYNINIVNSYGKGSQAIALSAYAASGYYACQIKGYQDTVLAQTGNQLYAMSYIEGVTDMVFGQYATAWFNECDIGVLAASVGYITANGRTSSSGTSYYVFNSCAIAAASGNTVTSGAYYLGRPWTQLGEMEHEHSQYRGVLFGEYDNAGAGASTSARASFSEQLSAGVSINTILGSGYTSAGYYDAAYM